MNADIRDNITCLAPFDAVRFRETLSACQLLPDLEAMPAGEDTELGTNGHTLSGGQKARIALARTAYQEKPLYLLDDPLAALDPHVAKAVLQECILKQLRPKGVVLCTHNQDAVDAGDRFLAVEGGQVREVSRQEARVLVGLDGTDGSRDQVHYATAAAGATRKMGTAAHGAGRSGRGGLVDVVEGAERGEDNDALDGEDVTTLALALAESSALASKAQLQEEEKRLVGTLAWSVYKDYWLAIGGGLASCVLLAMLLMQSSRNISDWWMAYWVNAAARVPPPHGVDFYLSIYGYISASNTVFTLLRAFFFAYAGVVAARRLHRRLLRRVLNVPLVFFDLQPLGRLVNRFSSDVYGVDDSLPFILNILLAQAFGLVGAVAVTCYSEPYMLLLLAPLTATYYGVQKYYRQTSREIKRLNSISRSPIYSHFDETLQGTATIRALRLVPRFELALAQRMHPNQVANYNEQAIAQWLGIRLQLLGLVLLAGVAFLAATRHTTSHANAGLVGLAISYSLSVTGLLQGLVTAFTETEKELVAVERCTEYNAVAMEPDVEEAAALTAGPLPASWPAGGALVFENAGLVYREGVRPSLEAVSFVVPGGCRVGICGRTGAGKSSLFQALLRLTPLASGTICIDGVNIAAVPAARLRRAVALIPQDPVLFAGTLRSNLDPFGDYEDQVLWEAVESCRLAPLLGSQGLEAQVDENGRNLSVGSRQLVCLARALIRKARVICVDEATANVDRATDRIIQSTIRTAFRGATVLTIAHRIATIVDSDLILVLDQGRIAEMGPPTTLLQDPNSLFAQMARTPAAAKPV
jgi:ATP-binding cassette subfamily C (CFTR/MRP) protein 10